MGSTGFVFVVLMHRGPQMPKQCTCHFKTLDTGEATHNKFRPENPHFWSELRTLLSSGAFCSLHVNWSTFLYIIGKSTAVIAENIRCHRTKSSWTRGQVPRIFAPMPMFFLKRASFYVSFMDWLSRESWFVKSIQTILGVTQPPV